VAVIAVPYYEPLILARWAFRALLERLAAEVELEADRYAVQEALALDGLHFGLLDRDQAARLAERLGKVADQLRFELQRAPSGEERDLEFAEVLAGLEMRLHDLYE
jgi:hypothetical protein